MVTSFNQQRFFLGCLPESFILIWSIDYIGVRQTNRDLSTGVGFKKQRGGGQHIHLSRQLSGGRGGSSFFNLDPPDFLLHLKSGEYNLT